jgi:uncharacterized DUF497 family protein
MDLVFEWNEEKDKANLEKHGISFAQAKEVFERKYVSVPSSRNQEDRYIVVGVFEENIFISVICTNRGKKIRIISARVSKKKEIQLLLNSI